MTARRYDWLRDDCSPGGEELTPGRSFANVACWKCHKPLPQGASAHAVFADATVCADPPPGDTLPGAP